MSGITVANIIKYKALRVVEKLNPDMYCKKCHWIKSECKCKKERNK